MEEIRRIKPLRNFRADKRCILFLFPVFWPLLVNPGPGSSASAFRRLLAFFVIPAVARYPVLPPFILKSLDSRFRGNDEPKNFFRHEYNATEKTVSTSQAYRHMLSLRHPGAMALSSSPRLPLSPRRKPGSSASASSSLSLRGGRRRKCLIRGRGPLPLLFAVSSHLSSYRR